MIKIPCVILCGGKSSRMGEDKTLLDFGGMGLAQYMYVKCQKIFSDVYLSCKDSRKFIGFSPQVLNEKESEFAPIFGITHALRKLKRESLFIVSVDLPFLQESHCKKIYSHSHNYDITYAQSASYEHYLCGVYCYSILPVLQDQINKVDYKISNFISKVRHLGVMFDDEGVFANLNTLQDYKQALKRIGYGK